MELICRQAGDGQRSEQGRGAGGCPHDISGAHRFAGKRKTRVGDEGCSGLGGIGNAFSLGQLRKQHRADSVAVVVVIGDDAPVSQGDTVDLHQMPERAGVFCRQNIRLGQNIQCAQGDVARGSDGGRHEMQPRLQRAWVGAEALRTVFRAVLGTHLGRVLRKFTSPGETHSLEPVSNSVARET